MSIDELETGTARGLEREILQLRALGFWEDAAELEGVRAALLGPMPASSHVAGVEMSYRAGWFTRLLTRLGMKR